MNGQHDRERRALGEATANGDGAAVLGGDPLDEAQTEACAGAGGGAGGIGATLGAGGVGGAGGAA